MDLDVLVETIDVEWVYFGHILFQVVTEASLDIISRNSEMRHKWICFKRVRNMGHLLIEEVAKD